MAIVTRYFSTTGAGAADGTTWVDRAALFSAGNWSTVITGFAFNGADSLKCLVGPGTYSCSAQMSSALFANPPTVANLLFLSGCDSSGVLLAVPDPDWDSAQAAWDDSTLPVIATTTNIATMNLANCSVYFVKFTASGRNGAVISGGFFDWCSLVDSTNNTAAIGVNGGTFYNSLISMTGAAYDAAMSVQGPTYGNVKLTGVTGTSGNRDGFRSAGSATLSIYERLTATGFGGDGGSNASATASHVMGFRRCTFANNGGNGILFPSTASQTGINFVIDCLVTGNGAFGIDTQAANVIIHKNRLRDNLSGDLNGFLNYPIDQNNYTTDSDDATEYVDAAGGDFRIKNTAAIWGQGFGAGDQPGAGAGTSALPFVTQLGAQRI